MTPTQTSAAHDAPVATTTPYLVSIVVNNFNYGHFLAEAIDSALDQTYEMVEVIVVDDGSTDNSRDVIAGYGDRIIPVLKENGGQQTAFFAGFQQSSGDIVIFLDADDVLLPHICTDVVKAFKADPTVSKVQYRLEIIDTVGTPTGEFMPPRTLDMPSGDLRRHMLEFPDDVRTPPTSGNAFAAKTLRQILPVPDAKQIPNGVVDPAGADLYLFNLAPLFGPVVSLPTIGGRYRIHGNNQYFAKGVDLSLVRRMIYRTAANHDFIVRHARELGISDVPCRGEDILSITYLANRIASLKLDPENHPIGRDTSLRLAMSGVRLSARRFDLSRSMRLLYMAWFLVAAFGPSRLTMRLVDLAHHPEKRPDLGRLFGARSGS